MKRFLVPYDRLEQALADDDNSGFCLSCGAQAYGVEPDAQHYQCHTCGEAAVYSAAEVLLMGEFTYDPATLK